MKAVDMINQKVEECKDWNEIMPYVRNAVDIAMKYDDIFESDEYTSILETVPMVNLDDTKKVLKEFYVLAHQY